MTLIEQDLSVAVAVNIDVTKWVAVARQKLFCPKRSWVMCQADDDDVAPSGSDQPEPTLGECGHQDFAQLRVWLDHGQQLPTIQFNNLACFGHAHRRDRRPAADH